jgi:hypothetical protein
MRVLEVMGSYFQGEKTEALVFILPLGLLSLVFGAWLLSENEAGFTRGVAVPFVVMGLVMTVVGGSVGFRTPAQVERLRTEFAERPAEALRIERDRMAKVNAAWRAYLTAWALFGIVGLGLRFATRGGFGQGLGVGLVLFAGVGLIIDGFAERRAQRYTAALEAEPLGRP